MFEYEDDVKKHDDVEIVNTDTLFIQTEVFNFTVAIISHIRVNGW